ncbi:hypothetical protein LSUB1_G004004 [Lachnellula subtilissima]|uniref:CFEM domain-containing protein n=1 Tax=Lachnellula subtilissima TaxID=602034 RepID=A0A8H8RR09_9HELO|nr:hypothetical protein LSUB1_G004004 [Lachnellula subtilissima]
MKVTYTTVIAILAAVAQAQSIADLTASLPACSLTCLQTAITGAGCSITDNACQCGSAKAGITSSATPCLLKACQVSDALNVQTITGKICDLVAAGSGGSGSSSAASGSTSAASSVASSISSSMASSMATSSAASSMASSMSASVASSMAASSSGAKASVSSAASSAASAASSAVASATSAPAASNPGSKVEAFGMVGAAAMLAAMAL